MSLTAYPKNNINLKNSKELIVKYQSLAALLLREETNLC